MPVPWLLGFGAVFWRAIRRSGFTSRCEDTRSYFVVELNGISQEDPGGIHTLMGTAQQTFRMLATVGSTRGLELTLGGSGAALTNLYTHLYTCRLWRRHLAVEHDNQHRPANVHDDVLVVWRVTIAYFSSKSRLCGTHKGYTRNLRRKPKPRIVTCT